MFEIDNTVPDNLLPKAGTYPVNVTKAEFKKSSSQYDMVELELTIPVSALEEQGIRVPVSFRDYVILNHPTAMMCKVKAKQFCTVFQPVLAGKTYTEGQTIDVLIGKSCKVKVRQRSDEYGDKLELREYIKGTFGETVGFADIPF